MVNGILERSLCVRHADGGADGDSLLCMEGRRAAVCPLRRFRPDDPRASGGPHRLRHRDNGDGDSRAYLGPTAETAKLAEQTMAVAGLFLTGVIGGAILFAVLGGLRRGYGIAFGLALGIILGIPIMLIIVQASQTASVGTGARRVWVRVG